MNNAHKLILVTALTFSISNAHAEPTKAEWVKKFDTISDQYQLQYKGNFKRANALAWAEAYYLDALIEMYTATQDAKYLDVFVTRTNQVLALAEDNTGMGADGYLGWGEWTYSVNAIQNAKAETADAQDATLPAHWERWQSTAETAFRNTATEHNHKDSNASFTVKTAPQTNHWHVLHAPLSSPYMQGESYDPNGKYAVEFKAKIENCDSGVTGLFQVYDYSQRKVLVTKPISTSDYQLYEAEFTAPSNPNNDVYVTFYASDYQKNCTVHFDDITVKSWREHLVHDGMISAPLAKFVKLSRNDKLPNSYTSSAEQYYDFIVSHILPKWQKDLAMTANESLVYLFPKDSASLKPGQSLPHNQYLALQRTYAELAQINNADPQHKEMAQALIQSFKSTLKLGQYQTKAGTSAHKYEWNYWDVLTSSDTIADGFDWAATEDISHGNLDVAAVVSSYKANIGFQEEEMRYFANTADFIITQCSSLSTKVNECKDSESTSELRWWMQLAEFKPSIYFDSVSMLNKEFASITGVSQHQYMGAIAQRVKGYLQYRQSFDLGGENSLPNDWHHWQSNPSTAFLSAQSAHSGTQGLTIKNEPTLGWQVVLKDFSYAPDATYRIETMGRTATGPVGGQILIFNATNNTIVAQKAFNSSDWSLTTLEFEAPASADNILQIHLQSTDWAVDGEVHFDDLEIYRVD
ncbi:hypothetical protein [Pseudoalteromonas sp. OOF1S-7]|uniref:hypothetical protein n=1 Tax=Pseudoalteromonas sp. OOF1S-7 TaxID=2917757 RepID=UPI001EF6E172|nr:hypothetical protein [Pseudoalteromonas sp. OOF1S-7]MCG7536534.1 hypothetical protein [Pseudoalteromonas sp. OOF1S-7]